MKIFDLNSIKSDLANEAYLLSEELITEYITILNAGYALQIGISFGKDSISATNAAIEAMKRCVEDGSIEHDHPIVAINIDTTLEPESTQMYAAYASKQLIEYCKKINVNLIYRTVSPPLAHQMMVLYAGAQKLVASTASGRKMDCSIIWKVDTAMRELKDIKANLPNKFNALQWISVSGAREDESVRRAHSMSRQNVLGVKALKLIERIEQDKAKSKSKSKPKVYSFAPISNWSTTNVFNYLNHAGNTPVLNTLVDKRIAAYDDSFGLLIAIYGEASGDVCEVVILDDVKKAKQTGCGKLARFGCKICLAVSEDRSAIESKAYPRWSRFGEGLERFRDYTLRTSLDIKDRAYHPRAFDPAANNNVYLQPNVLKAKVLEKMVWYAAQISKDYKDIHAEFVSAHERGETHLDVGIIDIQNDNSLSASVKKQYLKMYEERLMIKPMYDMFSDKHAILLSLLWSLHGVTALPYRPCAILESVNQGKRIPYPKTNAELNAHRASMGLAAWNDKTVLNDEFPDALCVQLFTPAKLSFQELQQQHGHQLNASHLQSLLPFTLYDFWQKSDAQYDALGGMVNTSYTMAKETRKFSLTYEFDTQSGTGNIKAKDMATGKVIDLSNNKTLHDDLLIVGQNAFDDYLSRQGLSVTELAALSPTNDNRFSVTTVHEFNDQKNFISDVCFFDTTLRKKADAGKNYSQRKRLFDKSLNSHVAGRASLRTYTASSTPELENQTVQQVKYWVPDFAITRHHNIDIHDNQDLSEKEAVNSFVFDDSVFSDWLATGGWNGLIKRHDNAFKLARSKGVSMRTYHGTEAVYHLTNNSGLTATERFKPYMLKTLKRTEVFFNAGLFFMSNKPVAEIEKLSNVITMRKHRAQKVQHLLAIRYLRNKRRNTIKAHMNTHQSVSGITKQSVNNIADRLSEFKAQYEQVALSYITLAFYSPLVKGATTTLRLNKLSNWLLEFAKVFEADGLLSVLATKSESDLINSSYDSKQILNRLLTKSATQLNRTLTDFAVKQEQQLTGMLAMTSAMVKLEIVDDKITTPELDKLVTDLANTITTHYARSNRYLIKHVLQQRLSYIAKNAYTCPAMGEVKGANKDDIINARHEEGVEGIQTAISTLRLGDHRCFNSLALIASGDAYVQRKLLTKVSIKAKTSKLSDIMSDQLELIAALRA